MFDAATKACSKSVNKIKHYIGWYLHTDVIKYFPGGAGRGILQKNAMKNEIISN